MHLPFFVIIITIAEETGEDFYARDAGNVDNSYCVVLLWAENAPLWLTNCGLCG